MAGPVVKSVLNEVIQNLPEDTVLKPERVVPEFLKKGVKQEELDYSQFEVPAGSDHKGRVTKEQLVQAEAERQDWFSVTDGGTGYQHINIWGGSNNPTYRENVYQFGQGSQEVPNRYSSSHHPDVENYLAHTRSFSRDVDGRNSHVVIEFQSDLHQQGRQMGYDEIRVELDKLDRPVLEEYLMDSESADMAAVHSIMLEYGYNPQNDTADPIQFVQGLLSGTTQGPPQSPYEKTWLKKTIEKEYIQAVNNGQQMVVPISGVPIGGLARAEGVQTWYETSVVNTMRKIAKQTDSEFELVGSNVVQDLQLTALEGLPKGASNKTRNEFVEAKITEALANNDYPSITVMAQEAGVGADTLSYWLDAHKAGKTELASSSLSTQVVTGISRVVRDAQRANKHEVMYAVIRPKTASPLTVDDVATDNQRWADVNKAVLQGVEGSKEAKAALDAEMQEKWGIGGQGLKTTNPLDLLANIPAKPAQFSTTLYTSPVAIGFTAYQMLQAGNSEEEVAGFLDSKGWDYDQIQPMVGYIQQAEAAGYNRKEIEQYLESKQINTTQTESNPAALQPRASVESDLRAAEKGNLSNEEIYSKYGVSREEFIATASTNPGSYSYTNGTGSAKEEAYEALFELESVEDVKSLVSHMEVVYPTMSSIMMTDVPAWFGNEAASQRYEAATRQSQLGIQTLASSKFGLQMRFDDSTGQWFVSMDDGSEARVTPGLWDTLKNTKFEMMGGVGGAIVGTVVGGRAGLAATGPFKSLLGRFTAPASAFGGGIAGGIIGAVAGTEFDYIFSAVKLHESMSAEVAAHKALTATELAVIGEAIGYPVAKGLGVGWKGLLRAKNMIFEGNSQGAYQALKEVSFLDDSQIDEIVNNLENLAPLKGSPEQKAISAVLQTQPGMQEAVRASAKVDGVASRAVVKSVSDRAESLLTMTANVTEPDALVSRRFTADLNNYVQDVKGFYDQVKMQAVNTPNAQAFQFDFDKLAIDPILDRLQKNITDPTVSQRFLLQSQRIRDMSESRDFGDLIELRQLVNDFLYNKRISKSKDADMLRGVIFNIDKAIGEGAQTVMDNPAQWLSDWSSARSQYSQMKQVQGTAFYKAIFDKTGKVKPVQPETVVKAFGKYITALDGSFMDVIQQLPPQSRGLYEGAVVNQLAQKYTVQGATQATDFVRLADDLNKVPLTTKDARAAKNAILEMAEVFKNDVHLANASGQLAVPEFQSYLTTDPLVRFKFEVASGVFNYIKTWAPGQAQRNAALVKQAAKLLEKPLNVKAAKDLQAEFADSPEILQSIQALQSSAARMLAKDGSIDTPQLKIYEGGKLKGTNQIASIPAHRIATLEQVRLIANQSALTMESGSLDDVLKQYGYKAVMQGSDRVRLLGE